MPPPPLPPRWSPPRPARRSHRRCARWPRPRRPGACPRRCGWACCCWPPCSASPARTCGSRDRVARSSSPDRRCRPRDRWHRLRAARAGRGGRDAVERRSLLHPAGVGPWWPRPHPHRGRAGGGRRPAPPGPAPGPSAAGAVRGPGRAGVGCVAAGVAAGVVAGRGPRSRPPAEASHVTTAPWRQDGDIVLRITGVVVRFGGLTAVDVDEMLIPSGAIVGIVGANGAGKTTLFDVLSGFVEPQQGSVVLDGATELIGMKPELRAQRGLGRSFQNATLFESMTVAETLAVAFHTHLPNASLFGAALGSRRLAERGVAAKVDELVELMGLASFYDKFIHELSTGSRRIVDLACVLAHRPRVL